MADKKKTALEKVGPDVLALIGAAVAEVLGEEGALQLAQAADPALGRSLQDAAPIAEDTHDTAPAGGVPPANIGPGIDEPLIDPTKPVGMYAGNAANQEARLHGGSQVEPAPFERGFSSDLRDPEQWKLPVSYHPRRFHELSHNELRKDRLPARGNPAVDRAVNAATRAATNMPETYMPGEQVSRWVPPGPEQLRSYQSPYHPGWNPTGDIPEPPSRDGMPPDRVESYHRRSSPERVEMNFPLGSTQNRTQRSAPREQMSKSADPQPYSVGGFDHRGKLVHRGEWHEGFREKMDKERRAAQVAKVHELVRQAVMDKDAENRNKVFLEEVAAARLGGEGEVANPVPEREYDPENPYGDLQADEGMLYEDQFGTTRDARDYRFMQPLRGGNVDRKEMEAELIFDELMQVQNRGAAEASRQLDAAATPVNMNSPVGVNNAPQKVGHF